MVASPRGTYCSTVNAEIISQIVARRNDFIKPIDVYKILTLFGENMITTEGHTWRSHRKSAAPAFSEKNNALVWKEAMHQAEAMVSAWTSRSGNSTDDIEVRDVQADTSTFSFHVITKAGFGVPLFWPEEDVKISKDDSLAAFSSRTPPDGHSMTFKQALAGTLDNILWFVAFPPSVMGKLPFEMTRNAYAYWSECNQYWRELYDQKKADADSGGSDTSNKDIIGHIIKAAGSVDKASNDGKNGGSASTNGVLTPEEIIGDTFLFMFAGQDTAANTLHFAFLGLAMNRSFQKYMQCKLEGTLGGKPAQEWNYEDLYDNLSIGSVSAVINETLRFMPPVFNIPKCTYGTGEQILTVDGKSIRIPGESFIHMNTFATHRNFRYWPHKPSQRTCTLKGKDKESEDLWDFMPERWLLSDKSYHPNDNSSHDSSNVNGNANSALFNPIHGAYLPFSEGPRGCIGRKFALVEITAALAYVFQTFSVELAVDKYASDGEVEQMDPNEREETYKKAIADAYETFDHHMEPILTLKIKKGKEIPLRFVKKGKERFPLGT